MREILAQFGSGTSPQMHLLGFVLCMGVSVAASLVTEGLYLLFYENRATGAQIHRSFILIGPAITLLFICVQLSLPLSLGLLGALSIVRFRTPIKEPEEIGFIMLLIAASVACATFNFLFLGILYVVTFLLLAVRRWIPWRRGGARREGVLLLSMAQAAYEHSAARLDKFLKEQFGRIRLESISNTEGLVSLHYVFQGARSDDWGRLQKELQEVTEVKKVTAFFSRQGGLR